MKWLDNLIKAITGGIAKFVAFVFFIFTLGMLFGLFIIRVEPLFLFVPPLLGLAAFYNEKLAIVIFAGLIVLFFL